MDRLKNIAGLVVAAVAIAAFVIVLARGGDDHHGTSGFTSPLGPAEFLYLDGPRILTYLSEMEGGEENSVLQIHAESHSESAGASGEGFNVGANSQYESKAEGTLVRTEASELGILLHDLQANTRHGVAYHVVDISKPGSLARIREGELVRFTTQALVGPGYIRPYVVVRDTATLKGLFPRELGSEASADLAELRRGQAETFAHQIGPDPRITFLVQPGRESEDVPTILLPMRYSALTTERSLLEKDSKKHTGGRVIVFGKVIRKFTSQPTECADGPPCSDYVDWATREVWERPIAHASNYLVERVSHNCKLEVEAEAAAVGKAKRTASLTGSQCFVTKLQRQTELFAPSAVIAPIAILK